MSEQNSYTFASQEEFASAVRALIDNDPRIQAVNNASTEHQPGTLALRNSDGGIDATEYRLKGELCAGPLPAIPELQSNDPDDMAAKINALIAHANLSRQA